MHKILSKALNNFEAFVSVHGYRASHGEYGEHGYIPMCVSAISSPLDWWGVRLEDYIVVPPAMGC